jgi:hypothetical protein
LLQTAAARATGGTWKWWATSTRSLVSREAARWTLRL